MGRAPCCEMGVRKGSWTPEEDRILVSHIQSKGHENWRALPKQAGLLRCGKSCRLRWLNYLKPGIKRGNFTKEEEDTIINLHKKLGNRWSKIAATLPGRTDNEIKNVWHTYLKKQMVHDEKAAQVMPVPIVRDDAGELDNANDRILVSPVKSVCDEISTSVEILSVVVTGTSNVVPITKVEQMNAGTSIEYGNFWTDALSHDINSSFLDCDIVSKPVLSLSNTFSSHCSSSTIKDDEINGWLNLYMESEDLLSGQAI